MEAVEDGRSNKKWKIIKNGTLKEKVDKTEDAKINIKLILRKPIECNRGLMCSHFNSPFTKDL